MILVVNVWGGDKMGADTENEINKIRWERWRAKQKTEREKTCFYCWDQRNQWNNWSDWVGRKPHLSSISESYNEYYYTITPKTMAVKSGETELVYLTAHLSRGLPMDDWIEIGAKRVPGWEKPFIYGAIDESEQFSQEFPEYPWEWNDK